jgi:hypothetical protein
MDIKEIRKALIAIARSMAIRVVEQVTDADLATGQIEAEEMVSDTTWHIIASYAREQDLVAVIGHPQVSQHPVFAMLGQVSSPEALQQFQENTEASFQFLFPGSWLKPEVDAP